MAIQVSPAASTVIPDLRFGRTGSRSGTEAQDSDAVSGRRGVTADAALSPAEQQQVRDLQEIDRRVRAHELAHISAGDGVVRGGARFSYTKGPDGRNYAVGGEVPIDASPARTPEETLTKARSIERAALAPVDPSAQDRRIATLAAQMAAEAGAEIAANRRRGDPETTGEASARNGTASYRNVQNQNADELTRNLLAIA